MTCDCNNPAQCWEPCGSLGHDPDHAVISRYGDFHIGQPAASAQAAREKADGDHSMMDLNEYPVFDLHDGRPFLTETTRPVDRPAPVGQQLVDAWRAEHDDEAFPE